MATFDMLVAMRALPVRVFGRWARMVEVGLHEVEIVRRVAHSTVVLRCSQPAFAPLVLVQRVYLSSASELPIDCLTYAGSASGLNALL